MANPPADTQPARVMRCMEIWGGNQAIDSGLSVPGIDAWVVSQPYGGGLAGGDIHYVSMCGGGRIARFMVADVSGHGEAVSDTASKLRLLMRRHINKLNLTEFIRALNKEFTALARDGTFATAVLTTYFAPTDQLIICNAGHPPPLWYSIKNRSWQVLRHDIPGRLEQAANLPLGIVEPTNYYQFAVQLEVGDLLLVYTDAVIEVTDSDGKQLGESGLLEILARIAPERPERFCKSLLDAVAAYHDQASWEDDTTLVLLHHNGADPPRQSLGEMMRVLGKMVGLVKV
jgi:sigma-B regulation protein RsbU (phosphoserine phosphatase)